MPYTSKMTEQLIQWIENLSKLIPLPYFVFIGSFLEEIIAPIPSPLVMSSAGTIIHAQQQTLVYILWIAIIGSVGKTIASVIWYFFSDKVEDFLVNKFGKKLKISHQDTEGIGRHFNNTKRDDIILFFLRAIPLFPNAPISILCGVIKLNLKTYISATFLGTVVKNLLYIYAGILSLTYLEQFNKSYQAIETLGYVLFGLVSLYFIYTHQKKKNTIEKIIVQVKAIILKFKKKLG